MMAAAIPGSSWICSSRTALGKARLVSARFCSSSGGGDDDDKSSKPARPKSTDNSEDTKKNDAKTKLNSLLGDLLAQKDRSGPQPIKTSLAKPTLKKIDGDKVDVKGIEPEVVHAASQVARASAAGSQSPEDDDFRQRKIRRTESDLLSKLRSVVQETELAKEESEVAGDTAPSLSDIIKDMKVAKTKEKTEAEASASQQAADMSEFRAMLTEEQLSFLEERKKKRQADRLSRGGAPGGFKATYHPKDIFEQSDSPLGIFEKGDFDSKPQPDVILQTWHACAERDIRILATLPPRNFLEDMARMTDRGELWHFPIDNEQGVDNAKLEPFYEHVFLEHHLEGWCPQRGPLRHFMDLVCLGLSKNPYISAPKKVEHINWYRDYFEKPEHKEILKASGAYD